MIAPIHGRDTCKGFQVLSADISFSFSILLFYVSKIALYAVEDCVKNGKMNDF